jgi:exportin-7
MLPKENGATGYSFREILQDISKFIQNSTETGVIGVRLLNELVVEINQIDESELNRSLAKHRKMSSSFRDTQLLEIFSLSCQLLKEANQSIEQILAMKDQQQIELLANLLKLSLNCLLFDFIGNSTTGGASGATDDSTDDMSTVQIPTSWRLIIMDFENVNLFFNLYFHLSTARNDESLSDKTSAMAATSLSCLVQLSAVRRSFFNNTERMKYLNEFCLGVKKVLQTTVGLDDSHCYHEFCRLLARLKCNYQLSEMMKLDYYAEIIQLIAKFTITSLGVCNFSQLFSFTRAK